MGNRVNREKHKIRLPFSAVLLYLSLLAILLCGVTFSKYISGTSAADSARVAAMKGISISETGNFTKPQTWMIIPGVTLRKNAAVHFEGAEMACYVFLDVTASGWTLQGERSFLYEKDGTQLLLWDIAENWRFLTSDGNSAVYYTVVPAGETLDAQVIANDGAITVSNALKRTELETMTDFSIDLTASAVQYYGVAEAPDATEQERAAAVWQLAKEQ